MKTTEVPFGFIKEGKVYLSGWADHKDREIGEVREDDIEKSTAFFVERYNDLKNKVDEVAEKIDTNENKGSFLMKLIHLKGLLPQHDGLGDYVVLLEKLEKYESFLNDIIQKNRQRNSEIKQALILEAKEAVEVINWREATEKVNDIKSRWIKTGNAEEDKNEALEEEFWEIVKGFFDRKKNFYEDKQKLIEHRTRQYEELVEEASKVNELHGKERFDKVKELRERWRGIGGIPAETFKTLITEFNRHLKNRREETNTDYTGILSMLMEVKSGKIPFDRAQVELLKKNIFKDRRRSDDKKAVLELIQLLTERDFINNLTTRRFSGFAQLDAEKKKSIRIGIIKDLILRDKTELKTYEENSANFTSSDGKLNKMILGKLSNQKKKISVKEMLLDWIEKGEF